MPFLQFGTSLALVQKCLGHRSAIMTTLQTVTFTIIGLHCCAATQKSSSRGGQSSCNPNVVTKPTFHPYPLSMR
eukprot:4740421-Amphidinium_carterae.1